VITSDETAELFSALVAAQAELPQVPKDRDNTFFKSRYATLGAVVATAGPVISKHGLAVTQHPEESPEMQCAVLTTRLVHTTGQFMQSSYALRPVKTDPQGRGSAITYARRYCFASILGMVVDEDDDGEAATARTEAPPQRTYTQASRGSHGSGGARQATPSTAPASEKQVRFLKQMCVANHLEGADAQAFVDTSIGRTTSGWTDLTKSEASLVIDKLQAVLNDTAEPMRPGEEPF